MGYTQGLFVNMTDKQLKQLQGVVTVAKKKEEEKPSVYFSTGHTMLDLVVGGGETEGFGMGFPAGTIVRDSGDTGSSKSFKATECIASNYYKYKDKFKFRYCDPETGNTIDSMGLYGFEMFPPPKKGERPVVTVEDWDCDLNIWLDSLQPDECGIYVLDSLDSITDVSTEARKEKRRDAYGKGKEFDDGTYAMQMQKFLSQEFFRGLTKKLSDKNALLYIISQERDNVGAGIYGKKNRTSGGRALGFYETVKITSKLKRKEEKQNRAVSAIIEITADKVRNPRPFRKCFVTIHFTYGLDSISDEVDFLFDLRSDKTGDLLKRADNVVWDNLEGMDRESLIQYITANGLRDELKKRVIDKWDAIEEEIKVIRPAKYG